ncbi:MAG: hypothetical protein ACYSW3_00295 [Planctomycetota bacterium]
MPFDVVKRGNKYAVVSPHGTKGTHSSRGKAQAQKRAIEANYYGKRSRSRKRKRKRLAQAGR